ncbi:GL23569 [Drosophila persimilis]|uniref:GL23569 n=1 Tax=Drosophila persimilis TaxID=7234 RepID=B4G2P0_DROPE|nr:GL23569 [Drosophila persimilis]
MSIDCELANDKRTCVVPAAFLLFSRQEHIGRISTEYSEGNGTTTTSDTFQVSSVNSQKPRNIAVHAMKARRLLFSTDDGSHQAIIRAGLQATMIYYK